MSIKNQEYHREWYRKNKHRNKGAKKSACEAYRKRKSDKFYEILAPRMKCSRCPENDIACLDFHHITPELKIDSVVNLIKFSSLKKALEEAEKCEVLCANCHRKHHFHGRVA